MNPSPLLAEISQQLVAQQPLCDEVLYLELGECRIRLQSNHAPLLAVLARYFKQVLGCPGEVAFEVVLIECPAPELPVAFQDWSREPGKSGRKDSYYDLSGGRLIRKVRTGMVFVQSPVQRIAAGPCMANDNQVINFINAQYMNYLQQRGYSICHAAALAKGQRVLGIAAFSGGGKSTLMLKMLENSELDYLTNDRLFIRAGADGVNARGIPKLPRINPGTIVNNPRLQPLIPETERQRLLALPVAELWELEQKYDVMIDDLYGEQRFCQQGQLAAFLVLNWRRDSDQPCALNPVELAERRDLLAAIMKSPGPFYHDEAGNFLADHSAMDESEYLQALAGVAVFEAVGRIDFEALSEQAAALLNGDA